LRTSMTRERSLTASEDEEETGPAPGKTRTRIAAKPKDIWEIKGDSESSDDERGSVHSSETNQPPAIDLFGSEATLRDVVRRIDDNIIDISDGSSDDRADSSDDGVDDDQIQAYLGEALIENQPVRRRRMQEESLIDWMLTRTRTIGGQKKQRKQRTGRTDRGRPSGQSTFKLDVTIGGGRNSGRERQSILNFERAGPSGRGERRGQTSPSRPPLSRVHSAPHHGDEPRAPKKTSRKQKEKERRARAKKNNIYVFQSDNMHIITGRRETATMTLDIEDEGFYRALAPLSQDWALPARPPPVAKPTGRGSAPKSPERPRLRDAPVDDDDLEVVHPPKQRQDIHGDFDIPALPSGHKFGPNTYIGRGWLHELITALSSDSVPAVPPSIMLCGIKLEPPAGVGAFLKSLGQIFDGLFDLAVSLPSLDAPEGDKEWRTLQHTAGQMVSWFLVTTTEAESSVLRESVKEQVLKSIARIPELHVEIGSVDGPILDICWFAVELSARIGILFSASPPNPLKQSVSLLVNVLLDFGLMQTMMPIRNGDALEGANTAQMTAELWVCLFHLLDTYVDITSPVRKTHPFWAVITDVLQTSRSIKTCLEASETIWRAIFSFCALTQFSVHGMTTSTSRIPPSWELVVLALKKIRLTADLIADKALSTASLDKRDEYIGLVTLRCFHLWNRWHWGLDEASILFNQLVEIFRSRKFASLRHERPEYPQFMLLNDWALLSKYGHGDTAFVLFLKLLVEAASPDMANPNRALSPRAKKLLSLAIPIGSLPFSKKNPTAVKDLSMLCNRLSAVAIGVYLDPSHHFSRINHARTYVDFSDADETIRLAVIRGLMYLAILFKNNKIPLEGIVAWVDAIANVLVNEFKNLNTLKPTADQQLSVIRDRLLFSVQMLIGAVRRIIDAYKSESKYPDPALLRKSDLCLSVLAVYEGNSEPFADSLESTFDERRKNE